MDESPEIIANARRRHGAAGAMLAAGMLAIDDAMGLRPKKDEAPIIVASPTEPTDIDTDGIEVPVDEQTSVYSPPQPLVPPITAPRARRRR